MLDDFVDAVTKLGIVFSMACIMIILTVITKAFLTGEAFEEKEKCLSGYTYLIYDSKMAPKFDSEGRPCKCEEQ